MKLLNRAAPKWGKKTEDLFVLDFFNSVDDMKAAFDPFYTATSLSGATDINVLHELKDALDDSAVYEWFEVEDFVARYFNNEDAQQLSVIIDKAAERFNHELELSNEEKADIKIKAKQFVKIYGQMAAIMPYDMLTWEKLFWFLKFLIPKLKVEDPDADLLDERIRGMPGHVNLIPLNDVVESEFKPSRRVAAFQKRLESHGLTATVRRSLGGDIDASCGQLRRKEMEAKERGQ